MKNRNMLKEAIAEAKQLKEAAIENAKEALIESFSPMLKEKLAAKIAEMEEEDLNENEEMTEENEELNEYAEQQPETEEEAHFIPKVQENEEMTEENEELDLEALLKELEGVGEGESTEETVSEAKKDEESEDKKEDKKEKEKEKEDEEEEDELDLENMSEEDLKGFVEEVISDMINSGQLEAGHEGMENEEGAEEMGNEEGAEEEIDVDSLVAEIKNEKDNKQINELKAKLKEAYTVIKTVQTQLTEVNLLNAKLLYTNKIFKTKSLNEDQKTKVLAAFDKTNSKKEAKLVYETIIESLNQKPKTRLVESLAGGSSKATGNANLRKPILEVNETFTRMQKLAGIKPIK